MRILFVVLVLIINTFANSLDEKIKELKSAPKEQRYKIMNQIKMELIKLNQSQREYFLQKLIKNRENQNGKQYGKRYKQNIKQQNINKIECSSAKENHQKHSQHKFKHKKNGQKNKDKNGHKHK